MMPDKESRVVERRYQQLRFKITNKLEGKDKNRSILDITVSVATIIGYIAIPIAIFLLNISYTSNRDQVNYELNKANHRLNIAKILLDNYDASCPEKLYAIRLIITSFNTDSTDTISLINYLTLDLDSCVGQEKELVNDQVKDLQADAVLSQDSSEEKEKVEELILERSLNTLDKYQIHIHYLKSNDDLKSEAELIKAKLIEATIEQKSLQQLDVKVRGLSQAWFDSTGDLSDNQIRYEREKEDQAAIALQYLLTEVYSKRQFRLQTIRGSSPKSVSIFLK